MDTSARLREFIMAREGCVLDLHWDAIGKVWDIGFGHVLDERELAVVRANGGRVTRQWAVDVFNIDILYYEDRTEDVILMAGESREDLPRRINQNMFDALVSLVYNVGHGALKRRQSEDEAPRLLDYLDAAAANAVYHDSVCCQILDFMYARKQPIDGLLLRRAKEVHIYRNGTFL
jgi:GH24 family phage-related lysozyme (muramidase)